MPITDVLQMMGRAGRPQFDVSGVACVFVHDIKKNFYKKFLYEPFPVESNLLQVLSDHVNAEIAAGTVLTKMQLMEYMTWTYFFRRLLENPSYYNLEGVAPEQVNEFLSQLVDSVMDNLKNSNCIASVTEVRDAPTLLPKLFISLDKLSILYRITWFITSQHFLVRLHLIITYHIKRCCISVII